jgi:serine/threonine-protein kinase
VQGNLTAALSHSGISFTQLWLEDLQSNRNSNSNPILLADHDLSDGRYSIIRPLCTSGQSTIYLALDSTDQTRVVLKQFVLPSDANLLDYTIAAHPLEIEAKVLSRLDHPNIPRLKDKLVEAGMAYLVCPFVDGMSLSEICKSGGPLEVGRVKTILVQAAILLQYLHSLQPPVVHRDFCPDNLILSEGDKVFLVDFGVAAEPNINPENVVVGKPSYIAPEQFRGRAVTQSDLYSLGAVAYFLLTGAEPEPLTQSNPGAMDPSIPQALDAMIEKLTAQEVKDRFQSATEVLSDLNLCLLTANH